MNRERAEFFEKIFGPIRVLLSIKSSLEEGMQATIDVAKELGIERICIFLKDELDQMTLVCGHPEEKHGLQNKRNLESHPGLKEIMEKKKMFIVKNPAQDKRSACAPEFCGLHQINASLFVRIEIDKKPIGVIVIDAVGEKKTFTKSDIHIAKMIALLATKRIHNRRRDERETRNKIFKLVAEELVHEMRNPVMTTGGFARRLEKDIDKNPTKAKKNAGIIVKEIKRMEEIIKNSSQLLNQGKMEKEKTNLAKIVEELLEETKKYIPTNKNITVYLDKKTKTPFVYIDRKQMETALLQIFRNAVDAIEKEGEIFVRIWKRPHFVCLEVANTGSHIPDEEIKTIFNPFYTTKRKNGGMGLGLAIAQQIIEEHEGQIEVFSQKEPKELTSFTVLLPVKKN